MSLLPAVFLCAAAQDPAPAPEPPPAPPSSEAPGPGEPPLAIPAPTSPPPPRVGEPGPPGSDAGAAHARAIREYRSRFLTVRPVSEAYFGTSWSYGWYGHPGPWGGGWIAVPHPFVVRRDDWVVFQGPARIDVPRTLGALGDVTGQQQLERRIRAKRTASGVLYGVGAAGIVGTVVGLVGADQSQTYGELAQWQTVTWTGVGLMVGGFVGGSFPASRAYALQYEPEATFDMAELQGRVQDHNQRLAAELGLDPMEAVRLEAPPGRP